jgi:hypothetical protein
MAEFTNYLEGALYDAVLKNTTYTAGATVYVSLHTASPTETGAVGELAVANGYAREAMAFDAHSGGSGGNSGTVTFTASGGSWGSITHFAIWDASSGGNALLWSVLDSSRTVNDGDSLEFAAASVTVTID